MRNTVQKRKTGEGENRDKGEQESKLFAYHLYSICLDCQLFQNEKMSLYVFM